MVKVGTIRVARAAELMTAPVVPVASGTAIREAAKALRDNHITGAPVVTSDGHVLGVVTLHDLVETMPSHAERIVDDVMTKVVFAIKEDDPAIFAAHLMIRERIHRAWVVRADGVLSGVITAMDIVRAISEGHSLTVADAPSDPLEFVKVTRHALE